VCNIINILTSYWSQNSGFKVRISTENAVFKLTDSVFQSVGQKMHVGGIFLFLTKAFDSLNHAVLFSLNFQ